MKFFSFEDWHELQTDWENARDLEQAKAYHRYLTNLKPELPSTLLAFMETVDLKQAYVTGIAVDSNAHTCTIELRAYENCCKPEDSRKLVSACYTDLESLVISTSKLDGLPGNGGLGDIGADEIAFDADGTFIHELLFSSGILISMRFRSFAWRVTYAV